MVDIIIILYNEDTVEFGKTLGIGILKDAETCEITEEINGTYELTMTYPVSGTHFKDIELKKILYTETNLNNEYQAFRIYSITKPIDDMVTINAQHISYDASNVIINPAITTKPSDSEVKVGTLDYIVRLVNSGIIGSDNIKNTYSIHIDDELKSKKIDFELNNPSSIRSIVSELASESDAEIVFNNKETTLVPKRGSDNHVVLNYAKNLENLDETRKYTINCNVIFPYYWKTETETNTNTVYEYQSMKIDASQIDYSYKWLYSESSTSSGVIAKVKNLLTSALLKQYIYKIGTDGQPEGYAGLEGNLYMWNTYNFTEVTEIADWEMANETSSEDKSFLDNLKNLPVVGKLASFLPSKEKMKIIKSIFSLYYSIYNVSKTDTSKIKIIDNDPISSGLIPTEGITHYIYDNKLNNTYTIYSYIDSSWQSQNRSNVEIHYDSSYDKNDFGLMNAIYLSINNNRLYCAYQDNTKVNTPSFLHLGPEKGVVEKAGNALTFFNDWQNGYESVETFVKNKYIAYIFSASTSSYSDTLYIARYHDNILQDSTELSTHDNWHSDNKWYNTIYVGTNSSDETVYRYYNDNVSFEVEKDSVYTENKWIKIATTKGLDPMYPSTSGSADTKTYRVLLSALNQAYFATDEYTSTADVASYTESWYYSDTNEKIWHVIPQILEKKDTRLYYNELDASKPMYWIYRSVDDTSLPIPKSFKPDELKEVDKLPTEGILDNIIYKKKLKDGTYDHYIHENSKWNKLTLVSVKSNFIYVYKDEESISYYYDNNFSEIDNPVVELDNYPQSVESNTIYKVNYIRTDEQAKTILDSYPGCIFLDKDNYKLNNILIQPIDLTDLVDNKNENLFYDINIESTSSESEKNKAALKLLDFIKEYYIIEPKNEINKITNETTLSYIRLNEDSYIDHLSLSKVSIGDTIHVRYNKLGIVSDLRIKSITYDVVNKKYTDITLGELTEKLENSLVTTSDGVSVLSNDSGYSTSKDVNELIAKSAKASKVTTENFESTKAIIDSLEAQELSAQQLKAVEAKIEEIETDPLIGVEYVSGGSESINIVTAIDNADIRNKEINYKTGLTFNWDPETGILEITINK